MKSETQDLTQRASYCLIFDENLLRILGFHTI